MKRFAWLTDVHLNFLKPADVEKFMRSVSEVLCDGILLSGDIGEANSVVGHLNLLATRVKKPVYFVLGNHDFYRGSIAQVRHDIESLSSVYLHWLPRSGTVPLSESSCLIGHDGWGDGRLGDYWGLRVQLNDWLLIEEFRTLDDRLRLELLHRLGDEAAAHFQTVLPGALKQFDHIFVVTHVPPFRDSCWHEGRISDDDWFPHFTCKVVGDVLFDAMKQHPEKKMTVLCGHTHGAGEALILPNLKVLTGGAAYFEPIVQQVLAVD
jgi:Icc protein